MAKKEARIHLIRLTGQNPAMRADRSFHSRPDNSGRQGHSGACNQQNKRWGRNINLRKILLGRECVSGSETARQNIFGCGGRLATHARRYVPLAFLGFPACA